MKTVTFDETRWKLVPVEPADEMHDACSGFIDAGQYTPWDAFKKLWADVLAVSPQPPATAHEPPDGGDEPVGEVIADADGDGGAFHEVEWYTQPDDIPAGTKLYTRSQRDNDGPVFHLRSYGDVTKTELDEYVRAGDIAAVEPNEQASDALNNWLDTCDESGSSIQHRIECAGINEIHSWIELAFNAGRDSVERPPAAERVPLSDDQIAGIELAINGNSIRASTVRHIVRLVEVAHGIKERP